jgi:cobyrinic acid a,c-diamide synthase
MHGIVVAGTHSGCGKTTVTLGLLAALKKKEFSVQAFKAGPDFIDAGLHRLITGRSSRNLDLWMCGKEYVRDCLRRHSCGANISIIEGVMGLYDGGLSTAALSVALGLPVVLVIDAYGMAESGGAVAKGFMEYGICEHHISPLTGREGMGKVCFLGVIFNRAASENHYRRLTAGVRDIPVLGYLPRDPHFEIPHRHLGLSTAEEEPMPDESLDRLAGAITRHIDLDALVSSAARPGAEVGAAGHADISYRPTSVKIAVARDRAFCFYYEDNLDLLRKAGAEIVFFSPLTDTGLPGNADCVYI